MPISSLANKLHIRPGYKVALINAPEDSDILLSPLPDNVEVVASTKGKVDLVLQFVKSKAEVEKAAKDFKKSLSEDAILWFAYSKVSSKVATDLTRDKGWKAVYDLGYRGVASISIDSTWSGIRFRRGEANTQEALIAKQYAGERATLLPLYERLVRTIENLGRDVGFHPRQSYVAFSRTKQFALIKPTRDHLDLGLKLAAPPINPRLLSSDGVGSGSMTHRVAITKVEEIDQQLLGWLEDAYRAAA